MSRNLVPNPGKIDKLGTELKPWLEAYAEILFAGKTILVKENASEPDETASYATFFAKSDKSVWIKRSDGESFEIGGNATWGKILGDITEQSDLMEYINGLDGDIGNIGTALDNHINDTNNPHNVDASQVGNEVEQWNANKILSVPVVDTDIGDNKILVYNLSLDQLEYRDNPPPVWGGITGDITEQGDLQDQFDTKEPANTNIQIHIGETAGNPHGTSTDNIPNDSTVTGTTLTEALDNMSGDITTYSDHANLSNLDDDHHPRLSNALGTGILYGGEISVNISNPGHFDIATGQGLYLDNTTDPINPTRVLVEWADKQNVTPAFLLTADTTYLAINRDGNLVQSETEFIGDDYRDYIVLGYVDHPDRATILDYMNRVVPVTNAIVQFHRFVLAFGQFNVSGNTYSPPSADLTLLRSPSRTYMSGSNYLIDPKNPNQIETDEVNPVQWQYYYRSAPIKILSTMQTGAKK